MEYTDMKKLCKQLGITSRAVRYYEEVGFVKSIRDPNTQCRLFDIANIAKLRQIIFLRSLDLTVSNIKAVFNENTDIEHTVKNRYAVLIAQIQKKYEQITLLEKIFTHLDEGKSIYDFNIPTVENITNKSLDISLACTEAFIKRNYNTLYENFNRQMREYLPESVLDAVQNEIILSSGNYISIERYECIGRTVIIYCKYEKIGVRYKYCFHDELITGFWQTYYELDCVINE